MVPVRCATKRMEVHGHVIYGVGSGIQLEINVAHVSRKVYDFQFKGTAFVLLGDLESL